MAESWKQWEGTTVDGKFRLERFLGGSEHSVVFLTELEDGRKAAIKFVPAIPVALDFQRTGWEQASRLSHPNLIRLFGTGQCRLGNLELVYAVMEYAEDNVAQILPSRALSAKETAEMLEPVLAALRYLHEKGLVHGSLKPTNVLAVRDQLKLSSDQVRSFGKAGLSQDISVFIAPEVAREGARAPSDSWSLGAMLIEVLTQKPPDRSSNGTVTVPSTLPDPFREIATSCLKEAPQDRPTLAQIAQAVQGGKPEAKASAASATASAATASGARAKAAPGTGASSAASGRTYAEPVAEEDSGRKVLVWGVGLLVLLGAIYFGSRLFKGSPRDVSSPSTTADSSSVASQPAPAPTQPAPSSPAAANLTAVSPTPPPASTEALVASPTPKVLERVEPNVSASARNTITGKIRVRVNLAVDESGKVSDARFITPGPSRYFSSRAMEAARKWTFVPPQVNGQPAPSKWVVSFTFTRKGSDSSAEMSSP